MQHHWLPHARTFDLKVQLFAFYAHGLNLNFMVKLFFDPGDEDFNVASQVD